AAGQEDLDHRLRLRGRQGRRAGGPVRGRLLRADLEEARQREAEPADDADAEEVAPVQGHGGLRIAQGAPPEADGRVQTNASGRRMALSLEIRDAPSPSGRPRRLSGSS